MKFITIIVFLIPVVVARHNHRTLLETILKSKGNIYTKVNEDVQNVMNSLFDTLNLAQYFLENSRIKLLLTMHYDLKSIAEKNFDVYEKMIDAADTGNKSANSIELFELIEEILDDQPIKSSLLNGDKISRKHIKHKTTQEQTASLVTPTPFKNVTPSEAVFADSKEFMVFIKDFIKKVDNLSEKDFSKPTPPLPPDDIDNFTEANFEVWRPPQVLELDYFNDSNSRRIFKGKRSRVKSYPFLVSIHLMGTFTCAGSIVTKDLVITAASCLQLLYNNRFYRENPRSVVVRVGSDYFARGGERIPIIEAYFHPSYDPKTLANNLVLLRLITHIRFLRRQRKVKRIKYDRTQSGLPVNTEGIIVVGWGSRKKNNIIDQFERMLVAQLDVYHVEECAEIYSKAFVTNKHFCAGFISSGGGACNKDLGGPGIVGGILVGVISFGAPICGSVDSPTVFTKLGHYAKWIDSIIKKYGLVVGVRTTPRPQTHQQFPYTSSTTIRINPFIGIAEKSTRKTTSSRPIRRPTTLRPPKSRTPLFSIRITNALNAPLIPSTDIPIATQSSENEDMALLQNVLDQLAQANNSFLRDILYADVTDDDFSDMFKTKAQQLDPLQHPLVNKSLFAIPGIHPIRETSEYVTVPLTTSSTLRPIPPQLTDPTGTTTKPPSRTPVSTTEMHFSDLVRPQPDRVYEDYEVHDYETETMHVATADYGSLEDIMSATTTAKPVAEPDHHQRHHHHSHRHRSDSPENYYSDRYYYKDDNDLDSD